MNIRSAVCIAALLAVSLLQPSSAEQPNPPTTSHHVQSKEASVGTTATATGTVKAIDATTGKITISHGPVAALQWPAMTMAFKATPAQMAAVHAGQKVDFAFVSKGMDATLARIAPVK